jgi:hypothetical protein
MTGEKGDAIDTMLELGKSALRGTVSIEEFHRRWPQGSSGHPLFQRIHEDVEDAVEHFPADPLTGKPDRRWEDSHTYAVLYLDVILLSQKRPPDELLRCREIVLTQKRLSKETVRQGLEQCLGVRIEHPA